MSMTTSSDFLARRTTSMTLNLLRKEQADRVHFASKTDARTSIASPSD